MPLTLQDLYQYMPETNAYGGDIDPRATMAKTDSWGDSWRSDFRSQPVSPDQELLAISGRNAELARRAYTNARLTRERGKLQTLQRAAGALNPALSVPESVPLINQYAAQREAGIPLGLRIGKQQRADALLARKFARENLSANLSRAKLGEQRRKNTGTLGHSAAALRQAAQRELVNAQLRKRGQDLRVRDASQRRLDEQAKRNDASYKTAFDSAARAVHNGADPEAAVQGFGLDESAIDPLNVIHQAYERSGVRGRKFYNPEEAQRVSDWATDYNDRLASLESQASQPPTSGAIGGGSAQRRQQAWLRQQRMLFDREMLPAVRAGLVTRQADGSYAPAQGGPPIPNQPTEGTPTVNSVEDAMRLPEGTVYIGPDGKKYRATKRSNLGSYYPTQESPTDEYSPVSFDDGLDGLMAADDPAQGISGWGDDDYLANEEMDQEEA